MIQGIATRLSNLIYKYDSGENASLAVMNYALILILNALSIIGISVIISLFTGYFLSSLIIMFSFALLRQISGGYHVKNSDLCVLISVVAIISIPFIPINAVMLNVLSILSAILLFIFAPAYIKRQTRIDPKYFPLLKYLSIVFVLSNLIFQNKGMAIALFIQSISTIHIKEKEEFQ